MDVEEPEQAVRLVLGPRRLPRPKPGHALGDAVLRVARFESEDCGGDVDLVLQELCEVGSAPEDLPVLGDEEEEAGRNELLQRPAPTEPDAASVETGSVGVQRPMTDIAQVAVTDTREGVVAEHGVDRL